MVVDFHHGTKVGPFWIYGETEPSGEHVLRVRHTVDEAGNYYEEKLTLEVGFDLGLALMREYSLHEYGHG